LPITVAASRPPNSSAVRAAMRPSGTSRAPIAHVSASSSCILYVVTVSSGTSSSDTSATKAASASIGLPIPSS
jgi:hypothetical protein